VSGPGWWLADQASRLLGQDEREAVRGDFSELGTTSATALREILGLVVRRQVGTWANRGPWLALVGLVLPLGFLLNVISRHWAASGGKLHLRRVGAGRRDPDTRFQAPVASVSHARRPRVPSHHRPSP